MTKKEKIFLCIIIILILVVIFMGCVAKKYYNIAEKNLNHYIDACDELWDKEQKIMILGDADCLSNAELSQGRRGIDAANFSLITSSFFTLRL